MTSDQRGRRTRARESQGHVAVEVTGDPTLVPEVRAVVHGALLAAGYADHPPAPTLRVIQGGQQ